MLFGDVHPYLAFDYAAPAMDSVIPVQANIVGGASGGVPLLLTKRVSRESKRECAREDGVSRGEWERDF